MCASFTVAEGNGPSLFGHDWLGHVTLDWKTIGLSLLPSDFTQVESLKRKCKNLFSPGISSTGDQDSKTLQCS